MRFNSNTMLRYPAADAIPTILAMCMLCTSCREDGREVRRRLDTQVTLTAGVSEVQDYIVEHGVPPARLEDLHRFPKNFPPGRPLWEPPRDAWGTPILYSVDRLVFRIVSAGPDRKIGTRDDMVVQRRVEDRFANTAAGESVGGTSRQATNEMSR